MREPKRPPTKPSSPPRPIAAEGQGGVIASVERVDKELPDGRYLLVFSRKQHA